MEPSARTSRSARTRFSAWFPDDRHCGAQDDCVDDARAVRRLALASPQRRTASPAAPIPPSRWKKPMPRTYRTPTTIQSVTRASFPNPDDTPAAVRPEPGERVLARVEDAY